MLRGYAVHISISVSDVDTDAKVGHTQLACDCGPIFELNILPLSDVSDFKREGARLCEKH